MITCLECNKEYRKLTKSHFKNHGMTTEEYLIKYPNASLLCEDTRLKYSKGTIDHFNTLTVEERKARAYIRTEEIIQKMKNSLDLYRTSSDDYKLRYTQERADKIAECQRKRWSIISAEDRSIILKNNQQVFKDRVGIDEYLKVKRKNGSQSYTNFKNKDNKNCKSSFELEMLDYLDSIGIIYSVQFEVKGWYFDCYVPSKNLLLEFDGDFWHPLTEVDCKYPFQFNRLHTDKFKDNVAFYNGYELVRIRYSEKEKIKDLFLTL